MHRYSVEGFQNALGRKEEKEWNDLALVPPPFPLSLWSLVVWFSFVCFVCLLLVLANMLAMLDAK